MAITKVIPLDSLGFCEFSWFLFGIANEGYDIFTHAFSLCVCSIVSVYDCGII